MDGLTGTRLWEPSSERVENAAMTGFMQRAQEHAGKPLVDYDALHAWSVEDIARFWMLYANDAGIRFHKPPTRTLSTDPPPLTRWFLNAELSYAQELLYPPALGDPLQEAVIGVTEAGAEVRLSFAALRTLVRRTQDALRRSGVARGDAVVAFAANVPEMLAVFLACAGLGIVFSSASPDFGPDAAVARFAQLGPRVLFASPIYTYGGRRFDTAAAVRAIAARLHTVGAVVAMPYPGEAIPLGAPGVPWTEWLENAPGGPAPICEPLPFDHPLYVLYSSGTTGVPKAIVHRSGGALLSHHKEHRLHSDIRPSDVVFYYTTCGWMMWNWLASALAQAATVVLYDGSPTYPDNTALWRLAERLGITYFGTSARYLHTLRARDERPGAGAELRTLRTIASTGSPLSPSGFAYVYERIKDDVHLASMSGGTDIVSCFMLGVPTLPVHAGEIQRPGLGVDMAVFDDEGRAVTGVPGELVCRQPLPSMPLRFVDDPGFERYRDAYFSHFPGVWRHGDLVERSATGGIVVYGRSDATLNPGGVRIGTAEIYRPLEKVPEVVDATAVARRLANDEKVWLLVVLREGTTLDAALEERIRDAIRQGASPRHVPRRIVQVKDLPRTRSGKSMEMAVARLVNGLGVTNAHVMANPEALEAVRCALGEDPAQ